MKVLSLFASLICLQSFASNFIEVQPVQDDLSLIPTMAENAKRFLQLAGRNNNDAIPEQSLNEKGISNLVDHFYGTCYTLNVDLLNGTYRKNTKKTQKNRINKAIAFLNGYLLNNEDNIMCMAIKPALAFIPVTIAFEEEKAAFYFAMSSDILPLRPEFDVFFGNDWSIEETTREESENRTKLIIDLIKSPSEDLTEFSAKIDQSNLNFEFVSKLVVDLKERIKSITDFSFNEAIEFTQEQMQKFFNELEEKRTSRLKKTELQDFVQQYKIIIKDRNISTIVYETGRILGYCYVLERYKEDVPTFTTGNESVPLYCKLLYLSLHTEDAQCEEAYEMLKKLLMQIYIDCKLTGFPEGVEDRNALTLPANVALYTAINTIKETQTSELSPFFGFQKLIANPLQESITAEQLIEVIDWLAEQAQETRKNLHSRVDKTTKKNKPKHVQNGEKGRKKRNKKKWRHK